MAFFMPLLAGCHDDSDQLFTTAVIELVTDDGLTIDRIQATAMLTNLNTKEIVTTSAFSGRRLAVSVLKGSYTILIEGQVRVIDTNGQVVIKNFRAYADYQEFLDVNVAPLELKIIFMP